MLRTALQRSGTALLFSGGGRAIAGEALPAAAAAALASATDGGANRGFAAAAANGGSSSSSSSSRKLAFGAAAATAGALAFAAAPLAFAEEEADHGLHPPHFPWSHSGLFSAYDHQAIRRGHQVYTQVCAACHSVSQLHYRNLVGVAYTEEEAKAMAAEAEVTDGPNDEGEMFERPGRLSDPLPRPYSSEEAARFANGGAYPPDLSLITKARHDGQNYLMALLLGYREPPAGVSVREGLYYNPYFVGGAIAMPKMLVDGGTDYDDGTPASEAQQAKDVTTFLAWAAEPEHDDRKLMGAKWILVMTLVWATALYYKRWKWAPIKSRRIVVDALH